jgi:hypothetical protein
VFKESLRKYIKAGAPSMRGISEEEYTGACWSLWNRCKTDNVYAVRIFVDPLIDTQFAEQSKDLFCVLVARCNPDGELIDAPPGYTRVEEDGIFLSKVVAGSPLQARKAAVGTDIAVYLFAYFDILGFKQKLKTEGLERVRKSYLELIERAITPQKARWSKNSTISSSGEMVPALMWAPIEAAFASDSIILYVPYDPQLVEEFFRRCALLFCSALRILVPLRGVITIGEGVFDEKRHVFIGSPLVEASSLEQELDWIGVVLGRSMQAGIRIPPHLVQIFEPPMTPEGEKLFGGLALDWPRIWRKRFTESALTYLAEMSSGDLPPEIKARYEHAAQFFGFSASHQDWCIPEGMEMITPDDL